MNQDSLKTLQLNLSGLGCWIAFLATIMLLGSIGLGWLVKSFFVLLAFIVITPIIGFLAFRWWLKRNLVQDACPVCSSELAGMNGMRLQCPSCGEPLKVEQGHFDRLTPPGTVDVQAVEVQARQIED